MDLPLQQREMSDILEDLKDLVENCTGFEHSAQAVAHPKTVRDVQDLVILAAQKGMAIYPYSRGNNWGYGSRSPMVDKSLLADLSRMKQILSYDEDLGLVTIQPGVTQKMLFDFLQERGGHYLVPTTGGGPQCSLVGNALERGFGLTPECDHFAAVMGLKAVLPDGSIYESLFSEMSGQKGAACFKWGIGPYVDGLFSQGNFGIVTEMTLALAPRPEQFQVFFFSLPSLELFDSAIEDIREVLKEFGAVLGGVNLMNDLRILSMIDTLPDKNVEDGLALSPEQLLDLREKNGIGHWTGMGTMFGNKEVLAAARKKIAKRLQSKYQRVIFLNSTTVQRLKRIAAFVPFLKKLKLYRFLLKAEISLKILAGEPSETALALVNWRLKKDDRQGDAIDPDRSNAGLLWFSPIVPIRENLVKQVVEMITRVCHKYDIDPLITLTAFNHRCFDCTIPVLFDRESPAQTKKAQSCYEELVSEAKLLGVAPYRTGIQGEKLGLGFETEAQTFLSRLKRAIDPFGVIAPGRYVRHQ